METENRKNVCNEQVYAGIYNRVATELHDYLYYKYGEAFNAADKAQEAFIKLWEQCQKVAPEKARAFLYTVANNMMLNDLKHQKVVLRYKLQKSEPRISQAPDFGMEQEEYLMKYQQALSRLSADQRTAFLLNKVEGKTQQEIADILGVTKKVVEYRIYSAFSQLRLELKDFNIK